jgi:hypothetical protein
MKKQQRVVFLVGWSFFGSSDPEKAPFCLLRCQGTRFFIFLCAAAIHEGWWPTPELARGIILFLSFRKFK